MPITAPAREISGVACTAVTPSVWSASCSAAFDMNAHWEMSGTETRAAERSASLHRQWLSSDVSFQNGLPRGSKPLQAKSRSSAPLPVCALSN